MALALGALALALAAVIVRHQRRRGDGAPRSVYRTGHRSGYTVPDQLDPGDLARTGAPWTVVAFTSASCNTCAGVLDAARRLACGEVAVEEVELSARRDLHERYRIDAVPTTVIVDVAGVVRAGFLGPIGPEELEEALAELRGTR